MGPDLHEITEAHVQGLRAGDPEATIAVYRALSGPVYGYLLRRMGDPEAAQDVTAEAFTEVLEGADAFEGPPAGLRAWVFRIARNRMVDHYRRESYRRHSSLDEMAEAGRLPEAVDDPESEVVGRTEQERILALTEELTPDQREVVLLRLVAELPVAEVAELMDRTPGAVKVLQHRALRSLADKLEEEEGEAGRGGEDDARP